MAAVLEAKMAARLVGPAPGREVIMTRIFTYIGCRVATELRSGQPASIQDTCFLQETLPPPRTGFFRIFNLRGVTE
jgi:hypothetical protein